MSGQPWGEALARYLGDPAHAGVYRLEPSRAAALADLMVETTGLDWHRLGPAPRWSREALLDGLAESLGFPDYFGRNWDAAWDCLTELRWEARRARVVVVPAAPWDAAALVAFTALMQDAAEHWAARGQALVTLVVAGEAEGEALEALGLPTLPRETSAGPRSPESRG